MALSRERIRDELLKLLVAKNAVAVLRLMIEHGILVPVLPEIDAVGVDRLDALAKAEAGADIAPHPIRRLAALVSPTDAEVVGARLKLSNAERKRLVAASAGLGGEGPRALAVRTGVESAMDRLLLAGQDTAAVRDWTPPRFPLTGGAIIARGITSGPEVARLLKETETRWIAAGFPDEAGPLADAVVAQALRSRSSA